SGVARKVQVELEAEDPRRLTPDVPHHVLPRIRDEGPRHQEPDHAALEPVLPWHEVVSLDRQYRVPAGHHVVAILNTDDEAPKILERVAQEVPVEVSTRARPLGMIPRRLIGALLRVIPEPPDRVELLDERDARSTPEGVLVDHTDQGGPSGGFS